ncbi:hypothetical protein FPRO04_07502 [Fusarium proliferatum]|nr:hypothetical protein FPRO03_13133 [Fusarium proliferatum]KAG4277205.1 hypothetical protein FPRO04_07502 [Fusarium proliferatum]
MAIHKPDNSGKASRQGDLNRARPGHGHARPRQEPRPHQRNHQATEQATRQAAGDSGGQRSHNLTNTGSQAGGIRGASYIPHGRPSGDNQESPHLGSGSSSQHQIECTSQGFRNTPLPLVAKSSQTQVSDKDGAVASQMDIKSMKGDCKEIAALPLPEQVKMLIVNRGNMVPFKGKKPWWKLLHEYCTSPQYDSKVVTAIPWSKEFTLALAKGRKINHMQLRHDTLPAYKLPKDEAFADPTSIYWKYWQPENLPWPAAFGNLPGRPSGPIDTDGTKAAASQTGAAARAVTGAAPCVNPVATPAPAPAPQRADPGGLNLGVPPGMASSLNLLPRPAPVDGQVPTPGNAPVAAQASVPTIANFTGSVPTTTSGDSKMESEINYSEDDHMH